MAEFKLFSTPQYHDQPFYDGREVSDHINEKEHRGRLLEALSQVDRLIELYNPADLADWGAGNGGFLHQVKLRHPNLRTWGYDMSPKAVAYAKHEYGVNVEQGDITIAARPGYVTVLTEVLEHMVSPHDVLAGLARINGACHYVIASSPAFEVPGKAYIYHLWAWTDQSYAQMFERCGWGIERFYIRADVGTQFVVAQRRG